MNILCPNCHNTLKKIGNTYKCINNHSFDIAKEGYLNLNMHNSNTTGDNKEMIQARTSFLEKGYYDFLKKEIDKQIDIDDALIDLACGEGYYTRSFKAKDKIGIDLSKSALKHASKKDKKTIYLLNSIFHNPIDDKSATKIITIFAPIAKEEIVRLLKKKGLFILVKPDTNHLYELKKCIYDNPYLNDVEQIKIDNLTLINEIKISKNEVLINEDINSLFKMTPYFNTTSLNDKNKLKTVENLEITFAFIIDIYQKD